MTLRPKAQLAKDTATTAANISRSKQDVAARRPRLRARAPWETRAAHPVWYPACGTPARAKLRGWYHCYVWTKPQCYHCYVWTKPLCGVPEAGVWRPSAREAEATRKRCGSGRRSGHAREHARTPRHVLAAVAAPRTRRAVQRGFRAAPQRRQAPACPRPPAYRGWNVRPPSTTAPLEPSEVPRRRVHGPPRDAGANVAAAAPPKSARKRSAEQTSIHHRTQDRAVANAVLNKQRCGHV
eukprot:gene2013-biopygen9066